MFLSDSYMPVDRAPGTGRGRLAQHATAALGGERHKRHEGTHKWRRQSLRTGRLVAEAYTPEVGWALGDGQEHGDDPDWDAAEATMLYERLEREVVPEFYARGEQGIPTAPGWRGMRESMALLTPRFSANRTRARVHRAALHPSCCCLSFTHGQ